MGADAYSDSIELFKSLLALDVEFVGLDAALDGRPDSDAGEPPKMSIPNKESVGREGFTAGAVAGAAVLVLIMSAVLGLTGGVGSSSKRSTAGAACRGLAIVESGGFGALR